MNAFQQRLIETMRNKGIKASDLSAMTGIDKSAISNYINGKYIAKQDKIFRMAKALDVDPGWLSAAVTEEPIPSKIMPISDLSRHQVPLIGSVAAGEPILAEEEYDVYIDAPFKADYALRIEGESMVPTYEDGDIIYIKAQDTIDYDGQIAVILLDDSATVKHVYREKDGVLLVSDNPKYKPMRFTQNDCNSIRIFGKVCGYTRMYKG